MSDDPAILTEDLHKSYGNVHALAGVDLEVSRGTVLGLLGPNGAGKTTVVRILTTLLQPDKGRATVMGHDVVRDAEALRSSIGLAGQYAAVDESLTGRENLVMVGRLYHLSRREAERRADEVLERFELADAASRQVRTYSGGMRRRLDLGASLVGRPSVLFLDEPTTGLDPRGRIGLWDVISGLVDDGTTLLLTTQYLEEADRLAHAIAVIDRGQVIAKGTADELKSRVGGEVLEVTVDPAPEAVAAAGALGPIASGEAQIDADAGRVTVPVSGGSSRLAEAVRLLDGAGLAIADLALRRPTLDDVFLALTGHAAEETVQDGQEAPAPAAAPAASGRRRSA
jgi:ABC-2 type transport system ATP-binding protein